MMVVIGGIIGAGIFLSPSIVAQRVDRPGQIMLAWVVGGAVALIGALCFGELGARRPLAGGGYVYLRETFGELPAFLYGWTQLLVINSGGIAAVAIIFAGYACEHHPEHPDDLETARAGGCDRSRDLGAHRWAGGAWW
jgi:APA family basic amino acid/polyamine antiporter